jgi:beta-aspartyl-dipeptidase (metallo-type)
VDPSLTLLTNAELYAPDKRGRRDILVGGGTVLAIGERLAPPAIDGVSVVDLAGARVVPGLVDSHVHLTGGGGESGPASRVPRVPLTALTRAGVTTAVGLLGTDATTRSVESLVAAALALREEGLSAYAWTGSYEVPPRTLTGSVRSDVVFVDPILGVGELALSDHRSSQPTFDELVRIAADCHVAGMMSGKAGVLHLHLGDGPRGLSLVRRALDETEIPARVFHPTHVNRQPRLFEEALALASRGVTVDVTAFPVEDGDPAIVAHEAIARYLASGAPRERLTCSSDGGGCLPTFDADGRLVAMDVGRPAELAGTLAALVSRGHALEDVLPVFTSNVATLLRLGKKGRIEVGADADLVVLDDTHGIRDVMARGRFVVRGGEAVVRGTFEPAGPTAESASR